MDNDEPPVSDRGARKDGKPFKQGNTRDDGSYAIGKGRTDPKTRFAKNDGRIRGRRVKGTRNLQTDWDEELSEKIVVTEGGKQRTVSKQRGIVKSLAARAMKSSDRAAEIALRHASARDLKTGQLRLEDAEIVRLYVEQLIGPKRPQISDDADTPDTDASKPVCYPAVEEFGNADDH